MVSLKIDQLLADRNKTPYWLVKEMRSNYKNINPLLFSTVTSIHLETIYKLCKALQCQPGDLFEMDEKEPEHL